MKTKDFIWLFASILLLLVFWTHVFVSCVTAKKTTRTLNDAAEILCELYASEQGMSVEDWCGVHENLQPFIDEVLSAQQRAGSLHEGRSSN